MDYTHSILATLKELEAQRDLIDPVWRDCFDLTAPERGEGFYRSNVNYMQLDTSKRAQLYDSTGTDSVALFASALMSGLTPSNSQWFNLGIAGDNSFQLDGASKVWLQEASKTMYERIHGSNYDAVALEFLKDIAIAGMSGLYITLDEEGQLVFEQWPLHSLYVQESKPSGGIDTIYRRLHLTPAQAFNLFGDKIPDDIKEALKQGSNLTNKECYVHCIRPRKGKAKGADAKLVGNMPFESVYIHERTASIVKQSGFNELPVIIPRWAVIPDTSYAVGPFYAALPDMKSLNELVRQFLTNAELVIAPPLVADDDGVIDANKIKIGPREIMFKSSQGEIKPLFTVGNLDWALQMIGNLQASIRKQMLADQIAPVAKSYMTAQEILARQDTIRGLLGPLFGRLESEFLRPMLERVFGLLYRAGLLGEPPESLVELEFKPTFTGPHARAQRMERANVLMNYVQALTNLAQVNPDVLDVLDFTKASIRYGELTGVETDLIRAEREIKQLRDQRAQAAQQQQAMLQQLPPEQ